jgi:chromosome segregation ATPase
VARPDIPWLPEGEQGAAESIPHRYIGGYDIPATRKLLASAETAYLELAAERDALANELEKLNELNSGLLAECDDLAGSREADRETTAIEVRKLRDEIARLTSSESNLRALWENAEKEMSLAQQMLERLQLDAEQISAELEVERGRGQELAELQEQVEQHFELTNALQQEHRELKQAHEAEVNDAAAREAKLVEELEAARLKMSETAEALRNAEQRIEAQERELASSRRREDVLTRMIETAKGRADTIRADARVEAALTLKKTRERERQIIEQAESQLKLIEAERSRITTMADSLREDLSSVLLTTLQQLNNRLGAESSRPDVKLIESGTRTVRKRRSSSTKPNEQQPVATSTLPGHVKRTRTNSG